VNAKRALDLLGGQSLGGANEAAAAGLVAGMAARSSSTTLAPALAATQAAMAPAGPAPTTATSHTGWLL
jgi:hypothetical protein